MSDARTIAQKISDGFKAATDLEPREGDAQSYNPSNLRNAAVDAFNLPADWKMNRESEKTFYKSLPEQMAQTSGSIAKVGPAKQIAQKLEAAMANGYKPTAAEGLALAKFNGSNTAVLPTHTQAAELAPLKPVKTLFNEPSKHLNALQSTPQGLVRPLKVTGGSGI